MFLYFIFIWSLLTVKLLIFRYACLFAFLKNYCFKRKNGYQKIFFTCAQLLIIVEILLASKLCIYWFSTHPTTLKKRITAWKASLISIQSLQRIQNVWLSKWAPQLSIKIQYSELLYCMMMQLQMIVLEHNWMPTSC